MGFKFLNKQESSNYLFGSLYYRAGDSAAPAKKVYRALKWYQMLISLTAVEGEARMALFQKGQLPFCFVYDIGYLLLEKLNFPFRMELGNIDVRLLNTYSNGILNRLLVDRSFQEAATWINNSSPDDLIAWLIGKVLDTILKAPPVYNFSISPSVIKSLPSPSTDYVHYVDGFIEDQQQELLEEIIRSIGVYTQQSKSPIFDPETIGIIRYWKAIKLPSTREVCKKILRWSEIFPQFDPRRLNIIHEEQLETELKQAGIYPTGGYAGINNKGSLESMLPSEMLYMDVYPLRGPSPSSSDEISFFDMRYVFNETLYFDRESGVMKKIKRVIHITIDPSNHRQPVAQGVYGLYAIYGLIISLVRNLSLALLSAVEIHLHILQKERISSKWTTIEVSLLEKLLEKEIAAGNLTIDAPEEFNLLASGEDQKIVYGIAIQGVEGIPAGIPNLDIVEVPVSAPKGKRPIKIRAPKITIFQLFGEAPEAETRTRLLVPWPEKQEQFLEHLESELLDVHQSLFNWVIKTF